MGCLRISDLNLLGIHEVMLEISVEERRNHIQEDSLPKSQTLRWKLGRSEKFWEETMSRKPEVQCVISLLLFLY